MNQMSFGSILSLLMPSLQIYNRLSYIQQYVPLPLVKVVQLRRFFLNVDTNAPSSLDISIVPVHPVNSEFVGTWYNTLRTAAQ